MKTRGPQVIPPLTFNEDDLGDAMRSLNNGRRAFVHFKVHAGLSNADAALAAGYSPATASMQGSQIAGNPAVQAAILEEARKVIRSEAPRSVATLVAIRDDAEASPRDRIKCAQLLMDRGGLAAVVESHLTVTHQLSESEQDRKILQLAAELGLGPDQAKLLLVSPGDFFQNAEGVYELAGQEPKAEPSPQQHRNNETKRHRRVMTREEREADKERVRAEYAERMRQQYWQGQATDAEFEELAPTEANLDDLKDVL